MRWNDVVIEGFKANNDGEMKKVKEHYIVEAYSFTEAEARATEELLPLYRESSVINITPVEVAEIFQNATKNGCVWYKCRVDMITLDEKSGKEKKKPCYYYVEAVDIEEARKMLGANLTGTISDWEISAITATKFIGIVTTDE